MIGSSLTQKLLSSEYKLVRMPLGLLDTQLAQRLSPRSRVRLTIERGLGTLDTRIGHLVADSELVERGALLRDHADFAEHAVEGYERAGELRREAEQAEEHARAEADQKRADAERQEQERIAQALREEQQAEQEAKRQARETAAAKRREARERAAAQEQKASQERAAKEQKVSARAQRATAPAKSTLHEAAKEKSAASQKRGQAAELSRLAETEKRSRQTQRTQNRGTS
jgi:hypothetical protein